jgi:heme-degrading monooxygenase HmoA
MTAMVARVWHGWAALANADVYERLLREEVFPEIAAKGVAGYRGIYLLRRPPGPADVEFMTVMWFDTWDAVRQFAGEDFERAYVPAKAQALLAHYDARAHHYEVRERLAY